MKQSSLYIVFAYFAFLYSFFVVFAVRDPRLSNWEVSFLMWGTTFILLTIGWWLLAKRGEADAD